MRQGVVRVLSSKSFEVDYQQTIAVVIISLLRTAGKRLLNAQSLISKDFTLKRMSMT
ncbi:Uncharacterised protein [Enterobacter hormaechei]|nr:hypothetical protein L406_04606 [Enterobacter sp. BWH 37]KLW29109.1 hypothetical protein SK49_00769 [Enterobacter sp. BWH63]CAH3699132.1 hypothetical protein AI2689V1_1807 [Enterobacter cloacae]CZU87190.1 Uncharacterised protein [Enterobacter hormaechei]CZX35454.1 Uncharacterised protein [Enterobacter hormaechei]